MILLWKNKVLAELPSCSTHSEISPYDEVPFLYDQFEGKHKKW